ncbi:GNAT family N-acetyltransferase, partial [Prevotella sp. MGM2]
TFLKIHAPCFRLDPVNEQNTGAVDFYLRMGFVVVGCDATDSAGRPFPVLHLKKDMGMAENV